MNSGIELYHSLDRKTRCITIAFILAALVSIPIGVSLDKKGFVVNILADIVTTTLGIWVAVRVIESILKQQSYDEWRSVSHLANEALIQVIRTTSLKYDRLLKSSSYLQHLISPENGVIHSDILTKMCESLREEDTLQSLQSREEELLQLHRDCSVEFRRIRCMTNLLS